jgi:hypothetical protein
MRDLVVAPALTLLVGGDVALKGFWKLVNMDARFRAERVLTIDLDLAEALSFITFTLAAGLLQMKGLIRYVRGRITLLNPEGLEAFFCECYRILSRMIRSSLPPDNLLATGRVTL